MSVAPSDVHVSLCFLPCRIFALLLLTVLLLLDDVVAVGVLLAEKLRVEHGEHEGRCVDGVRGVVAPVGPECLCTGWPILVLEHLSGFYIEVLLICKIIKLTIIC